jgi:hypothetical protein
MTGLDPGGAAVGLADDFEVVGGAEDGAQVSAHHRLVVDPDHPDGHRSPPGELRIESAVGT